MADGFRLEEQNFLIFNIKQVMDIAPYEIIPIQGFHVRQKEAKTVTIYE
mgnify:CR=1 FL=1